MKTLADRIRSLPIRRAKHFLELVSGRKPVTPIKQRALLPDGVAPASFQQEQWWTFASMIEGYATNHLGRVYSLRGPLSEDSLLLALRTVVEHHSILNSRIRMDEGHLVQARGTPEFALDLQKLDASALSPESRRETLDRVAAEAIREPFDLSTGPLVRFRLLQMQEEEYELVCVAHHLVWDQRSHQLFWDEFCGAYEAVEQVRPMMKPPEVQYSDYARWQNGPGKDRWNEDLDYWIERLRGFKPILLPVDYPRPAVFQPSGAIVQRRLSEDLSARLFDLAKRGQSTLYMVMLTAYLMLLQRYTGKDDLVIGTPFDGRRESKWETLIGFFVNLVAVRSDVSGDPTFFELLERVRADATGSFDHAGVAFSEVVRAVNPPRDPSSPPICQVELTVEFEKPISEPSANLSVITKPLHDGGSRFDISLIVTACGDQIDLALEYNKSLYKKETAKRFLEQLQALLTSAANDPTLKISELSPLTSNDRQLLLGSWNDTDASIPGTTLVEEFEVIAREREMAIAVTCNQDEITYGMLNDRADRLASHLLDCGVQPGHFVIIAAERSIETVIAMLGVLKAGAAYVPIDPAYTPPDRFSFVQRDCRASIALCDEAGLQVAAESNVPIEVIRLGAPIPSTVAARPSPPHRPVPTDLAYVIFTSGSSGEPKGVMIEHRSAVNFIKSIRQQYGINREDGVLQFASTGFDVSVYEVFVALLTGAKLHIPGANDRLSETALSTFVASKQVTVAELPPAVLSEFDGTQFESIRILSSGGEAVPSSCLASWILPGRRIFNGYGPTEATVAVTQMEYDGQPIDPPIGKPMANHRAYVVDQSGNLLPIGMVGELWISGVGVARGYLNRPDLDKVAFCSDPFDPNPGRRVYKTGDLCRWDASGNLVFIGRKDRQVQFNGHRIEPSEIEQVLLNHPSVQQAAVVVHEATLKRLHAFVVVEGPYEPKPNELVEFIASRLPRYMVPARVAVEHELPLTGSGKIDLRALAIRDIEPPSSETGIAVPVSATGAKIAMIVAELLELETVEPKDNFFQLGGGSLKVFQLLARVKNLFGVTVPPSVFFRDPTAAALAVRVDSELDLARNDEVDDLSSFSGDSDEAESLVVPASPFQTRLWNVQRRNPNDNTANIPLALMIEGRLDVGALERAINAVVMRHDALRVCFCENELGGIDMTEQVHERISVPVIDVSDLEEEELAHEVDRYLKSAASTPFSFDGPLYRVSLVKAALDKHLLILTFHHIVFDGWSIGVLFKDLEAAYTAALNGRPLPSELSTKFRTHIRAQGDWRASEEYRRLLSEWTSRLHGAPELTQGLSKKKSASEGFLLGAEQFQISAHQLEIVKSKCGREAVPLYFFLLSAYAATLAQMFNQSDIVIGTPVAGRDGEDLEDVIGLFVNTWPMRVKIQKDMTISQLIAHIKNVATTGYDVYTRLPFEDLIGELPPDMLTGVAPLCQTVFALQNTTDRNPALEGLSLHRIRPNGCSKLLGILEFYSPPNSRLDLSMTTEVQADGLECLLEYNRATLDKVFAKRVVETFQECVTRLSNPSNLRIFEGSKTN